MWVQQGSPHEEVVLNPAPDRPGSMAAPIVWVPEDAMGQPLMHGQPAPTAAVGDAGPVLQASLDPSCTTPVPMPGLQSIVEPAWGERQPPGQPPRRRAPNTAEERAKAAREKNRLAQRRFREKERQRIEEVEARAAAMRLQVEVLRRENEELTLEQTLLEKTLRVRNAMLSLAVRLDHDEQPAAQQPGSSSSPSPPPIGAAAALLQDEEAVAAESRRLADALGALPTLEQLAAQMPSSSGGTGAGGGGTGLPPPAAAPLTAAGALASSPAAAPAALVSDFASTAESVPQRLAVAGSGGSVLADVVAAAEQVEIQEHALRELPPADHPVMREQVQAMSSHEELVRLFFGWQARARGMFMQARAGSFSDAALMGALEREMRETVQICWHTAQLKPRFFNAFFLSGLPPPEVDRAALWRQVAAESLPLLNNTELCYIRRAYTRYTRRAVMAAVGVRPWARRLQELLAAPGTGDLATLAKRHLLVGEVAARLTHACQEQYVVTMSFLADLGELNAAVRCFWLIAGGEYIPDHPAIIGQVLQLHQEQQARAQQAKMDIEAQ